MLLMLQDYSRYQVPVILVGNKNDLWHDREVVTDKACQVHTQHRQACRTLTLHTGGGGCWLHKLL